MSDDLFRIQLLQLCIILMIITQSSAKIHKMTGQIGYIRQFVLALMISYFRPCKSHL